MIESPLWESLDNATNNFLFFAGLNQNYRHYKSSFLQYVHFSWNCMILLFAFGFYFAFVPLNMIGSVVAIPFQDDWSLAAFLLYPVTILQGISLCCAIYFTSRRLFQPFYAVELSCFPVAVKRAYYFVALLLLFQIPYIVIVFWDLVGGNDDDDPPTTVIPSAIFVLIIPFIGQSFLFSFCFIFLSVDTQVCSYIILDCMTLQEANKLSFLALKESTARIARIVQASKHITNALVITAIFALLYLVVALIVSRTLFLTSAIFLPLAFLSRELIFLLSITWEIAKVNELSNRLTASLSVVEFQVPDLTASNSVDEENVLLNCEKQSLIFARNRYQLYIYANGNPISFRLIGLRLTRKDIITRFLLWVIGIIIGIARQS
jgi:hypothetical protein